MGVISQTLAAAFEKRTGPLMDNGFFDTPEHSFEGLWRFNDGRDDSEEIEPLEGTYPARVTGVEESDDLLALYFEISCGEWAGTEVCGDIEHDLSRGSEGKDWAETILRRPLEDSERLDFDINKLVGERCEVRILTSFDSPSVVAVYGAPSEDPELEDLRLREEVLRHDPLDPECMKRQCERSERLLREAEDFLASRRADRASGGH